MAGYTRRTKERAVSVGVRECSFMSYWCPENTFHIRWCSLRPSHTYHHARLVNCGALTYSCLALMMRGVFVNFVALLTHNAMSKRCVFADLYTWFIYNTLYIRLKLAGSSNILTKFMDAQRRTALIFVTQSVGCASCMWDWGIPGYVRQKVSSMFKTGNGHYRTDKSVDIRYYYPNCSV